MIEGTWSIELTNSYGDTLELDLKGGANAETCQRNAYEIVNTIKKSTTDYIEWKVVFHPMEEEK